MQSFLRLSLFIKINSVTQIKNVLNKSINRYLQNDSIKMTSNCSDMIKFLELIGNLKVCRHSLYLSDNLLSEVLHAKHLPYYNGMITIPFNKNINYIIYIFFIDY